MSQFGVVWSVFGPKMDYIRYEQDGWTNLKSKEARNMLKIWLNKYKLQERIGF